MILVLAARFRRYIALFFYGLFYSQLILAAQQFRVSGSGRGTADISVSRSRNRAMRDFPRLQADVLHSGHGPAYPRWSALRPDSNVIPVRNNGPIGNLSTSPSFRLPAAASSSNAYRPESAAEAVNKARPSKIGRAHV